MWLTGYWMERGFQPEEILSLSSEEKRVWQAIAELNREQRKEDMTAAFIDAMAAVLKSIKK